MCPSANEADAHRAVLLHVTGVVQGVGFRPHVHNLATRLGLTGWVLNSSEGVSCFVQGPASAVGYFIEKLVSEAPPVAVIDSLTATESMPEPLSGFEIRESKRLDGAMTLVSPDIATCDRCVAELRDPGDRRFHYPFINCTNCGPRFTIIDDVPYDRPTTTMRDFPMCPECAEEYADPADRRFHAQPDACFACGPRLYLNVNGEPDAEAGESARAGTGFTWHPGLEQVPRPHRDVHAERERSDAILAQAALLLKGGRILAVKGLGGFHLACDATDERNVSLLRQRKNRWGKPLAVMMRDVEEVRTYCEVDPQEEALLTGSARPIVLVRKRIDPPASLARSVSGDLPELGIMLPYTPLHHRLLDAAGVPLVMTSGNLSEEPIAANNQEALERLARIADAFLLHDREIRSRYDDSVMRVIGGTQVPVRRARSYAPYPLAMPHPAARQILAVGPEQKNTFTLAHGEHAFVSQHIGDLDDRETLAHFEDTIALYGRLFRIEPELLAHDMHPEYLSTKYALASDLPRTAVQHHHAHIASVTAEHGIDGPVAGIAFDGTGFGTDGSIWGGEVLLADHRGFERFAHLAYVPMPGGSAAIRRPARMAIGTLHALGLLDHPGVDPLRARLKENEETTLLAMLDQGINSPLTSSMGRLFDTVAAVTGLRDEAGYEGEAAIELEAHADPSAVGAYAFETAMRDGVRIIDPSPVLLGVLDDIESGASLAEMSMRFHRAVVNAIVELGCAAARETDSPHVALAGGVFMNRIVLEGAVTALASVGCTPLVHVRLPMNDGAISYGQAVIAEALSR